MNEQECLIHINGRFLHEKIYTQDYPIIRKYKSNFEGIDVTRNKYTDEEVSYYSKYNSNGFRCDEFTNNHNGLHILFAGCSETVGEGSIIDDSWSKMLYNKISLERKCSGFFSLGIGGGSWLDIVSAISQYIDNYGIPDYLFINFPGIRRFSEYIENAQKYDLPEDGVYRYAMHPKKQLPNTDNLKIIGTSTMDLGELYYIPFSAYIRLFEKFCIEKNIKLMWGTWCDELLKKIDRNLVVYNNFVRINPKSSELVKLYTDENMSLEKIDGHLGTAHHYYWSSIFYNRYKEFVCEQ